MKLFSLLVIFCFSTITSFSCGCSFPGTTSEEFEKSQVVFEGKVIQVSKTSNNGEILKTPKWIVLTAYKGVNIGDTLSLTGYSGNCSYRIKKLNRKHIVYGSVNDTKVFLTSVCTRNKRKKRFRLNKDYKKEKAELKKLVTQK